MDLILQRTHRKPEGIFGELLSDKNAFLFMTLEHAYKSEEFPTIYLPKIAAGRYLCVRGIHALEDGVKFETFEITGLPDFQGKKVTLVLFHKGNWNKDSKGCVLVGEQIGFMDDHVSWMIMESKKAFEALMGIQVGVDKFWLTVIDPHELDVA